MARFIGEKQQGLLKAGTEVQPAAPRLLAGRGRLPRARRVIMAERRWGAAEKQKSPALSPLKQMEERAAEAL